MASMKRRKLWKTGGEWAVLLQQCHPNSAGSLIIAKRTKGNTHSFVVFLCVVGYLPNWGKRPRYIDRIEINTTVKFKQPINFYSLLPQLEF